LVSFLKKNLIFNLCWPLWEERQEDPTPEEPEDPVLAEEKWVQREEEEKARLEEELKYKCPDEQVTLYEVISFIEKYYDETKSIKNHNISDDDINRDHKLYKMANLHYLHIKGVELILHEFKEIIVELALWIKGRSVEEGAKLKVRAMLKKFIDESIMKNEGFVFHQKQPERYWPASYKNLSKRVQDEKKAKQDAERRLWEKEKQDYEISLMAKEDIDVSDA